MQTWAARGASIGSAGFSEPSFSKKWAEAMDSDADVVPPLRKERPSGRRAEQVAEGAATAWDMAPATRAAIRKGARRIKLM
jgi:hypothetical protein